MNMEGNSRLDYCSSSGSMTSPTGWTHFSAVDNPIYSRRDDFMERHSNFPSATMSSSSGSGGSTKYMIRDVAPTHSRFGGVLGVERALDGRLHTQPYTIRTPTPEASRYEPNFMLSPSSTEYRKYESRYKIHPPSPKAARKTESRYMVRPKLHGPKKYDTRQMLHPPTPELPRSFESRYGSRAGEDSKDTRTGSLYDSYWHIPRASLWCQNKGCAYDSQHSDDCSWKQKQQEDTLSTCSSINPPPTFTALDNYRPVRPRPKWHHCSCGIIFAITTVFSLLVLLLIAGFIIYIEMVLKYQTATATDRM